MLVCSDELKMDDPKELPHLAEIAANFDLDATLQWVEA